MLSIFTHPLQIHLLVRNSGVEGTSEDLPSDGVSSGAEGIPKGEGK